MRKLPAGVAVIATGDAPFRVGMTATAICSLSAEPPQVLVCLNTQTGTGQAVRANGRFSVNLLTETQTDLARRFAGMDGASGDDRFDGADWVQGEYGTPVLLSAMQQFECSVADIHQAATHIIVVGRVQGLTRGMTDQALIYRDGTFGTFAPGAPIRAGVGA